MTKYLFLAATLLMAACGSKTTTDVLKAVELPMTADGKIDTARLPAMHFKQEIYDFGKIKEGEKISFAFQFSNTGKTPLIVSSATASCGCTVPTTPEEPIQPGENGMIEVVFNSEGKMGFQNKTITIVSNTIPNTNMVYLRGEVLPNE